MRETRPALEGHLLPAAESGWQGSPHLRCRLPPLARRCWLAAGSGQQREKERSSLQLFTHQVPWREGCRECERCLCLVAGWSAPRVAAQGWAAARLAAHVAHPASKLVPHAACFPVLLSSRADDATAMSTDEPPSALTIAGLPRQLSDALEAALNAQRAQQAEQAQHAQQPEQPQRPHEAVAAAAAAAAAAVAAVAPAALAHATAVPVAAARALPASSISCCCDSMEE